MTHAGLSGAIPRISKAMPVMRKGHMRTGRRPGDGHLPEYGAGIIRLAYADFRRADERTRTADLLITSARSVVAERCTGLQYLCR